MLQQNEFIEWLEQHVKTRWPKHDFNSTEMGDWHWRLREFDIDTLTQSIRRHKVCEDWRDPSLKKVYEYARTIKDRGQKCRRRDDTSARQDGVPEAHTYIMCVGTDDNGRGCVGWFVPVLIWPFHKTYTAEAYRRTAEEQCALHARRGGIWKTFTNTTHGEMLTRRLKLTHAKPFDLNSLRKRKTLNAKGT